MIFLFITFKLIVMGSSYVTIHPRGVNLALETSFLFDSTNDRQHLPILTKLRSVIDTLSKALSPEISMRANNVNTEILTDFLTQLGNVIIKYEDEDLINIIEVVNEELDGYYEKKKTVYDPIMFNPKLRMYFKNVVKKLMNEKPSELRERLKKFTKDIKSNQMLMKFNSHFVGADEEALKLFLNDFQEHTQTGTVWKLSNLVRDTLKYVVFDRYEKLNDKSRSNIKDVIYRIYENGKNKDDFGKAEKVSKEKKYKLVSKEIISEAEEKSTATTNLVFY